MTEKPDLLDYLNKPAISVDFVTYWDGPDNYDYARLNTLVWKLDGKRTIVVEVLSPFSRSSRLTLRSIEIRKKVFYNLFTVKNRLDVDRVKEADRNFILGCAALELGNVDRGIDFNSL